MSIRKTPPLIKPEDLPPGVLCGSETGDCINSNVCQGHGGCQYVEKPKRPRRRSLLKPSSDATPETALDTATCPTADLLREIRARHRDSNLTIRNVRFEGADALVDVEVCLKIQPGTGMSMVLNALHGFEDGLVPLDAKSSKEHGDAAYVVYRGVDYSLRMTLRLKRDGSVSLETYEPVLRGLGSKDAAVGVRK